MPNAVVQRRLDRILTFIPPEMSGASISDWGNNGCNPKAIYLFSYIVRHADTFL